MHDRTLILPLFHWTAAQVDTCLASLLFTFGVDMDGIRLPKVQHILSVWRVVGIDLGLLVGRTWWLAYLVLDAGQRQPNLVNHTLLFELSFRFWAGISRQTWYRRI